MPKDDYLLKDLEPLGWIKTQPLELAHLSPTDVTTQAKLMADHPEWGSSSICLTCSFTPGSVSLSAHSLSVAGFEWGRKNVDTSPNPPVCCASPVLHVSHGLTSYLQGFNPTMSERVQLLLSDRVLGMTLVPEGKVWNYGIGLTQLWSPTMSYSMTLDTPLLFWAEEHRPAAFLTVSAVGCRISTRVLTAICPSSRTWSLEMIVLTWRTAWRDSIVVVYALNARPCMTTYLSRLFVPCIRRFMRANDHAVENDLHALGLCALVRFD